MNAKNETSEPSHVEKAKRAIQSFHTAYDETATGLDRAVDRATAVLGTPGALISTAVLVFA